VDDNGKLKSIIDVEPFHKDHGMNCLHAAIKNGHNKIVEIILLAVYKDEIMKVPYKSLEEFVNFPKRNGLRPLKIAILLNDL
jgi:hypothetical protein